MRIKISYKVDKIPISYRMMMVSLIKKALSDYNQELFESLYYYNGDTKNRKTKDFTFAIFLNDFKKEGDEFLLNELSLNISSPNKTLMLHMYNALNRLKEYKYNNKYTLKKESIDIIQCKSIKSEYSLFKTMSPVVVKNREGYFLDVSSEDYISNLNHIVDTSLRNYRGYGLARPIGFVPINIKKVVLKEKITSFTKITSKEYLCMNSFKGVFALTGDVSDLNDIYLLGLGFRRNQGCGMIDIV